MFFRSWKQIVRSLFSPSHAPIRAKTLRNRPELEPLEDRVTPAVIVTFRAGVLSVTGDNAANVITLERRADARLAVTSTNSQVLFLDLAVPTMNNVASILIRAGGGNDLVRTIERGGSLPGLTILGDAGNDTISGGSGSDKLFGGTGNDRIVAGAGDDRVDAGAGADTVLGGAGVDSVVGGDGDDVLLGEAGDDVLLGGVGNDRLDGGAGDDRLDGNAGHDILLGAAGNDRLNGNDGADQLLGGAGDDFLFSGAGADAIDGGAGDDTLDGGADNDVMTGGAGNDTQSGGLGDDLYLFNADLALGFDTLIELAGQGIDGLNFSATTALGVAVDLGSASLQVANVNLALALSAGDTFENAVGGAKDDTLTGNTLVNTFTGGLGKDTFVHKGAGGGVDTVTDMSAAQQDAVSFVTGGALSASALTIDATAKQLRDVATGAFGFNFTVAVLNGTSFYNFGSTDTATPGSLFTFNGVGGLSLGANADALLASYASNGVTLAGADFRQRILDYSANGNTLAGRDGADILDGGAGNDNLNGDQGFNPGGNDNLTGGLGADSFFFGQPFSGATPQLFGADTVTDFGNGADTVKLATGLSVRSGLGATTVVIWNGTTNFGTIFASNGHLWVAGDFT